MVIHLDLELKRGKEFLLINYDKVWLNESFLLNIFSGGWKVKEFFWYFQPSEAQNWENNWISSFLQCFA